ncbi:tyrosine-type recombinase/integrase [Sulfurimonas aquatica]|uniref:tyrosine-type recombinase/integrase n=1 Tax=Sulfurimonas aquatica TaxID=2672570 RepID=UPI001A9834B5|nr:tyrosine-type recombinase/integrase [Sulfurimonas aquatica]
MSNESLLTKLDKYNILFIKEKKVLNCSINTISTYTSILNNFYEYILELDDIKEINELSKEIVVNFLNYGNKSSNNTQILKLAVLKSYFTFIDEKEDLKGLFELRFKKLTIKKESVEVDALTAEEVVRLLELFKKRSSSFNKNRDALLIKLILFTGIRASECLAVKLSDISLIEDESVYKIKIAGKGSKERFVYIKAESIQTELEFLVSAGYITNYITITNTSKPMSRIGLYNMVSNKMKKAKIAKSGVHILRHTFARNLVSKNINLSTISELLGHADITLTARTYAKSDEQSKIRAIIAES